MSALDRAVLRSVLGEDGYREIKAVSTLLDRMVTRGSLSREGLSTVLELLAEEIVAQAVTNDVCEGLSAEANRPDTLTPEDPL